MKKIITLISILIITSFEIKAQEVRVIPRPNHIEAGKGTFALGQAEAIFYSAPLNFEAAWLQNALREMSGAELAVKTGKAGKNAISLELDPKLLNTLGEEGYAFSVSPAKVTIRAAAGPGIFYGVQTLLQTIRSNESGSVISAMTVEDRPRFQWRAFMLDEARYFKGKEQVKLLLDEMARLKMNTFHWHLVDDQGWRIEIKKYPLLTETGSVRKSSQVGAEQWKSNKQSGVPHSGFYTQDEIREIVAYAAERHIRVVPEIEMPGHSSAAIAAYPWLGTEDKKIEVPVKFGRFSDIYDVTDPKVNSFIEEVLLEVFALFPSKVIHIGGDEVSYDAWIESEQVNAYMKENDLQTYADLQLHFTNRISRFIEQHGRQMMGWNEIMGINVHHDFEEKKEDQDAQSSLAKNVIVHFWKGDTELIREAAMKGYQVVNSLHTMTYLDYTYAALPLQKAYGFDPVPEELAPEYHENIIGTGCQMWGEWIPTPGELHYQVFPRIAAYAEVGWTRPEHKNYEKFRQALLPLLEVWEAKGIYFAPLTDVELAENPE